MTSFAESLGYKPFNFRKELRKKKPDWEKMEHLAAHWETCGCGNCDERIPKKTASYEPQDDLLWELGIAFHGDIIAQDAEEALKNLDLIARREAELLAQLTA